MDLTPLKSLLRYSFFTIAMLCASQSFAQQLLVSNDCIAGTATLEIAGMQGGKPAYNGLGTVSGIPEQLISIAWNSGGSQWVFSSTQGTYAVNFEDTPQQPPSSNGTWLDFSSCGVSQIAYAPLPVELISFSARQRDSRVELVWSTASESQNAGFTIQRSGDAQSWIPLGFVNALATEKILSSYAFTDTRPTAGPNYYRLAQIDLDGTTTLSEVVSVSGDFARTSSTAVRISPNPSQGNFRLLNDLPQADQKLVELYVYDAQGRQVYHSESYRIGDLLQPSMPLPPGLYHLHLVGEPTLAEGLRLFIN